MNQVRGKRLRGMVLAAGLGKRLRPLTWLMAKPAVPFLGKPLIHYSLDLLGETGIRDIAVNLHYMPQTVESVLEGRPESIRLSREDRILGTGGCLGRLRDFFKDSTIVISNGKIFFADPGLDAAIKDHHDRRSWVTMVLVPFRRGMPYQKVYLDRERKILGFSRNISSEQELRKLSGGTIPDSYVFTGIQIIDSGVLDFIPDGPSDTVSEIYPKLIDNGIPLRGFISEGFWKECSTPERYLEASLAVMGWMSAGGEQRKGMPDDGTYRGDSVKIPESTSLYNSIIWDDSRLGKNSSFENVIVAGTEGSLPDGLEVRNAVVTPLLEEIPEKLPADIIKGPNYMIWPIQKTG